MTLPELTAYVRKRLRKGYPAGMLQEELLRQGHPADTVDQSFTPKRQWAGAAEGFGWRQLRDAAGFISLGLLRIRQEHWFHFAIGCIVTGIACLLIRLLYWYENR